MSGALWAPSYCAGTAVAIGRVAPGASIDPPNFGSAFAHAVGSA
jgi:hypothetical protein